MIDGYCRLGYGVPTLSMSDAGVNLRRVKVYTRLGAGAAAGAAAG